MNEVAFSCPDGAVPPVGTRLEPSLPVPVALDDDVSFCCHTSAAAASARACLLRRGTGFVMIDAPTFSSALAKRYATAGPITDILLTHRDHAAHGGLLRGTALDPRSSASPSRLSDSSQ